MRTTAACLPHLSPSDLCRAMALCARSMNSQQGTEQENGCAKRACDRLRTRDRCANFVGMTEPVTFFSSLFQPGRLWVVRPGMSGRQFWTWARDCADALGKVATHHPSQRILG